MAIEFLDPTAEKAAPGGKPAPRLTSLSGRTVGIISNGKEGTKRYFAHVEHLLLSELGVAKVDFCTKANYSAPAEAAVIARLKSWDAVVAGVGD